MKYGIFILLIVISFPSLSQDLKTEARRIKKDEKALWYADSSFAVSHTDSLFQLQQTGNRIKTLNPQLPEMLIRTIGYAIGFLIIFAVGYAVYTFRKEHKSGNQYRKNRASDTEIIEDETDLYQINFPERIRNTSDNRLAVRYYYLWLLQDLSKRKLIAFEKNKTNHQYAQELKNHRKSADFNKCTRYYNYVWYGEHPVSEQIYEEIVFQFKKLLPHE